MVRLSFLGVHVRACVRACVGGWVGGRAGGRVGGWVGVCAIYVCVCVCVSTQGVCVCVRLRPCASMCLFVRVFFCAPVCFSRKRSFPVYCLGVWGLDPCSRRVGRLVAGSKIQSQRGSEDA